MNCNITIAKRFETEFKWWFALPSERNCWVLKAYVNKPDDWELFNSPFDFMSSKHVKAIVINDKYAKFRKAVVEGETIICKQGDGDWDEVVSPNYTSCVEDYKIKAEASWRNSVSKDSPVICRVWDSHSTAYAKRAGRMAIISTILPDDRVRDVNSVRWDHAEPIMAKDLQAFQREDCFTCVKCGKEHNYDK